MAEDENVEFVTPHKYIKNTPTEKGPSDGGGVRRGDHLPCHRYIRNTSTCGTTLTEHLLNVCRRPQTSQKTRNYPCTWVGQKKKEKKWRPKE